MRQLLILLIIVFLAGKVPGQMTAAELETAVASQSCESVAIRLAAATLSSEAMKFNGAICFYENGEVERALQLFEEIRRWETPRQHSAALWAAKCHAALHQDSLALACLQAIPASTLNAKVLAQPVFDHLRGLETFTRLEQSVAPAFNFWTGLLAIIAVLGLLISGVLVLGKSRFSSGEKRLSLVVFAASLILVAYVLIWTGYNARFPYLQNLWPFLTLLIGPSLYFYLKDTFQEEYPAREVAWHYLIPALSGLLTLPALLSTFGVQTGLSPDLLTIGTSAFLLTGHLIFYAVLIHSMTSNDWQVDTNIRIWTRVVDRGMMVYTGAFLSYFVLVRCSFFNAEWDYAISFVMALGILAIAYMGLVQKRVFRSEPIGHFLPVKKYETSALTTAASESIRRGMERLLNEEQVFRENELRLADLAAYLDVSYHQLSQVINEHYGVNFFELINRYRVAYVKKLLADPRSSHQTIIQIAYEAGFNNKASFNRYFKKEIGMTPSAYRIRKEREVL